jgi:hypothetical protein
MAQKDPWAEFEPVVQTPQQRSAPQPVLSLPSAGKAQERANDAIRTDIAVESNDRARTAADQDKLKFAQDLRKEFTSLKPVQEYQTVVRQFNTALNTEPTPSGDQALITAYAKMLDPGSVVRETEFDVTAQADSAIGRTVARIGRELGIDGQGRLSPEARAKVRQEMLNLTKNYNMAYNQQRKQYAQLAQSGGFEPETVIGPHIGGAFFDGIKSALERDRAPKQANQPEMRGGLPVGTAVQFNMDGGPDGAFDRTAYLKDAYGVTPEQESAMIGFWNANRGNANLTPEQVMQFYAANGLPTPDPAALGQTINQAKQGYAFQGLDTAQAESAYRAKLEQRLQAEGFDPTSGQAYNDRTAQGILQGFGDEVKGVGGALAAAFSDEGLATGYTEARDLERLRQERYRDAQGVTGYGLELGGNVAGGLAIPTSPAAGIRGAIRTGATAGGIAGFGYGEGLGGSVGGAALGAGAGAALGAGASKLGDALAARAANRADMPLSDGAQVVGAADRLNTQFGTNIQPMPADVAGVTTRRVTGGAAQFPLAAGPIIKGAQNVSDEAMAARDAIAGLFGTPTTREAAGDAALSGAQKFIKTSRNKVNALYTKAKNLGGAEPVDLAGARAALDAEMADLQGVPGGSKILEKIQKLRADLDGEFPVQGVRQMRTEWRDEFLKDNLRGSNLERIVNKALDAADDDIVNSLNTRGKGDAARAYAEAANAHKERVEVIDQVLAPIIGKKGSEPRSVEQIMGALDTASKTNGARLGKFMSSLPPEDASTVRGTLIQQLGKASNGTNNAAGDAFSLPQFLTQWNAMSGSAKSQLFSGELRAALDDLARVSQGTKESQRFANFSNTGGPIGLLATGVNAATFFSEPVSSTAALAGQYLTGKLLASPSFARWLAKMPKQPALAIKHTDGLTKIAAADSVIAADALGLQRQLIAAFEQGPQKLAAEPVDQAPSETTRTGPAGQ